MKKNIEKFDLATGTVISNKFTIVEKIGSGLEGEVYRVEELLTKSTRAIKLYYPKRNLNFKVSTRYSQKLFKLTKVPILMSYVSHEIINLKGCKIACLISEYIEGEILSEFVLKQKGKRLDIFTALHLLYSIVKGVESIHLNGEYHGDLHDDNIIIRHFGLEFDLKIIDLHHWGDSKKDNRDEDIIKMIRIFYDILGGQKHYSKLAPSIRYIICGLKRNLILQRFKKASDLRIYLETMDWSDAI